MRIIAFMFTIPVVKELYLFIFPSFSSMYGSDYVFFIIYGLYFAKIVGLKAGSRSICLHDTVYIDAKAKTNK